MLVLFLQMVSLPAFTHDLHFVVIVIQKQYDITSNTTQSKQTSPGKFDGN